MSVKRIDISAKYRGTAVKFKELLEKLCEDAEALAKILNERDRELFEDILANTISKKIRAKNPGKQALGRENECTHGVYADLQRTEAEPALEK